MAPDFVGKTVGGYRLSEILARGSTSTVYAAEHTASSEAAAVKIFSTDFSRDKNTISRLVADIEKATAIKHPRLVPVLAVGTIENKGKRYLYIATPRLKGESLKARLQKDSDHTLPLAQALTIAGEVGAALMAVHRAGQTHRHINAGAVMLCPPADGDDSGEEQVYLLDLGTALVPTGDAHKIAKGGRVLDDVRGLAQLVEEMLGGLPDGAAAGGQAVLPLHFHNRKVPARVDAVLRSVLGESLGSGDRGPRIDSVATLLSALLGTDGVVPTIGAWSEDGKAPPPVKKKSFSLLWASLAAALGGAGVAYWLYAQEQQNPIPVPPGPPPPVTAAVDAGARDLSQPRWPVRPGVPIPPLREADPAPPTSPVAPPPATPAKPPAPPAGTTSGPAPAGAAKPVTPSAPADKAAPSAAQPQPPREGPQGAKPTPPPDGQKEVK